MIITPAPTITQAERAYLEACLKADHENHNSLRHAVIRERLPDDFIAEGRQLYIAKAFVGDRLDAWWQECRDRGCNADDIVLLYDSFQKTFEESKSDGS